MSLDALRKLRMRAEEALTMELAQVAQELIRMERQHEALEARLRSEAAAYQLQTERGLEVEAMLEWQGRLDSARTLLQRTRHAIGSLTEAWAGTQARLIEAARDRKVLDRLAERRRLAQDAEIRRRERQAMDEAAGRHRLFPGKGLS
jgi:flagellar export protein FliJ